MIKNRREFRKKGEKPEGRRFDKSSSGRQSWRSEKRSIVKADQDNSLLMGRNSLCEVLKYMPERLAKVYVARREGGQNSDYNELLTLLNEKKILVEFKTFDDLTEMTGSDSHQSFVAVLREQARIELKEFLEAFKEEERSLVLLLDSVEDPQNLGTILRSAECFGVDAVIWSKNRGSGITPVCRKASVGASELVTCIEVSNLVDAIRKLKDGGYWIVAAENKEGAQSLDTFSFPPRTALVVGSEGAGIRDLTCRKSDYLVQIPLFGKINSLNVAQAATILLHSYRRQI